MFLNQAEVNSLGLETKTALGDASARMPARSGASNEPENYNSNYNTTCASETAWGRYHHNPRKGKTDRNGLDLPSTVKP